MQRLITCILILGFVSPCLCLRRKLVGTKSSLYNVIDYGAHGDGKSDDSQAFLSAWKSACGATGRSILVIPPTKSFMLTYLLLTGTCKATTIHIRLQGKIVAPSSCTILHRVFLLIYRPKVFVDWITIEYVNGLIIDGKGQIDGDGSTWWQCKTCNRPKTLYFHACNNLIVSDLSITNSPGAHISINRCNGATFSNISIHSPPQSPNTDGFDISDSKNILIHDSNIKSGDDCIAINRGCSSINVTRVACGPGHGISIGSLGRNQAHDIVEEIHVRNCTFKGTSNGARIKTCPGGSGYARKITFEQIQLIDVCNPIIIDQHYTIKDATDSAVQVSDVTYREINGTSNCDIAIYLDCRTSGCSNLILDQINIVSSQPRKKTQAFSRNAHGIVKSTIPNVSLNH